MSDDLRMDSNPMNVPESDEDSVHSMRLEQMLPTRGNINPQIIELLEDELDLYENVSMVFLLYDIVPLALQRLKIAESAHVNGGVQNLRLLSDWARSQPIDSNWESKFLEALSIIQNYYVIEKMGYYKEDVIERYLPCTPDVAINVDLMRKALYTLCEKLTTDETAELIRLVQEDLEAQPSALTIPHIESNFLEVHILNWIQSKYIAMDAQIDLSNIVKHLKVMGKHALIESIKSIAIQYERLRDTPEISEDDYSDVADNNRGGTSRNNVPVRNSEFYNNTGSVYTENGDTSSVSIVEDVYHIDPANVGCCVIINQKTFYRDPDSNLKKLLSAKELDPRTGTDADRDRLEKAFEILGFTIKIWNDLDHLQLLEKINEAANTLVKDEHSCFVLCILSHGIQDEVYGVNSIPVSIDEIKERFNGKKCPKLINKPKVFIIQACQGNNISEGVDISHSEELAVDGPSVKRVCSPMSDTLTSMSTVPGYVSFRHRVTGSWFIQVLCEILLTPKATNLNMLDVLTELNGKIKNKYAIMDKSIKTMQPVFSSTLTKKLCFPVNNVADQ